MTGRRLPILQGRFQYLVLALSGLLSLAIIAVAGLLVTRYLTAERHYRAAETALAQRDFPGAQAHLAEYLKVWPGSSEAHFLAARTARRAGRYDEAEDHLKACQRLGGVPEAIDLERALLRVQRGDLPKQLEDNLLYYLQNDHPDSVLILEALSRGYHRTYQLAKEVHCLNTWLEREPDTIQALLWRAEASTFLQQFQRVLDDYKRVLELDPQRDDARLQVAAALVQRRQAAEALPHFEQLRQNQPENIAVLVGLARCHRELDNPEKALAYLDEALRLAPKSVDALRERGQLARSRNHPDEAERWLRQVVAVAPYDREATSVLALCLQQQDKTAEAKIYFAKVDEIDKKIEHLEEVTRQIALNPQDPALRYEAGMIFLKSGNATEGLRWLRSALEMSPYHAATHQALLEYFDSIGDAPAAARHRAFVLPPVVGKAP